MVKAEETRYRLMTELQVQFSKADAGLIDTQKTAESFDDTNLEKPKMFIPKTTSGRLELITDTSSNAIRGIGFNNTTDGVNLVCGEVKEIYSMKEFIETNPENMKTFSYDEKVVKAQLALVKRREWQDVLFSDVDWFKKIDLAGGIKRIFKRF